MRATKKISLGFLILLNYTSNLTYAGLNSTRTHEPTLTENYEIPLTQEIYERTPPSNILKQAYTIRVLNSYKNKSSEDQLSTETQKILTESPTLNYLEITSLDSNRVQIELQAWIDSLHYSLRMTLGGHFIEGSYESYKTSKNFTIELTEADQLRFDEMMKVRFNIEVASQIEYGYPTGSKKKLQFKSHSFSQFTSQGKTLISGRPHGVIITHPSYSFKNTLSAEVWTKEPQSTSSQAEPYVPLPSDFSVIEEIDLLSD